MADEMKRRVAARALLAAVAATSLAACGVIGGKKGGPKTPVTGTRTSILSTSQAVEVDPALATVPVTLPDPLARGDWAQPGGDASKAVGHLALSASPREAWTASIQGSSAQARLAASPVVSGGKLFVVDTEAVVHAFDARSGARLWDTVVKGADRNNAVLFGGGVSVDDDKVYVATGIGDVAALNAADGSVAWKVRPGGPLRGAPTIANGQLYVISQDNQIFALNPADGSTIWTESGTLQVTAIFGVAAPAAAQGTVIAGYSSGELTAYRYENGRVLWGDALSRTSISTSVASLTDIDADPVIDRGRVFAIGQGGRMASYELVSGQRLWEINVAGISTPAVLGEWVFVVTDGGKLLCVARATGRVRWISQLKPYRNVKKKKNPIRWSGPVVAGGHLVLVSTEGDLAFADPATGSVSSQIDVGQSMSLPPVVADNMLYLLTDEGRVIAYR